MVYFVSGVRPSMVIFVDVALRLLAVASASSSSTVGTASPCFITFYTAWLASVTE